MAALAKRRPDLVLPEAVWRKPWVVHCTAWGDGVEAVLEYLARYVHRVAITNNRIVGLDDDGVTIRHKERASGRWRHTRLTGHEFMRRFLQHVLPSWRSQAPLGRACTRSATTGCGILPGASRPRAPGCCSNSTSRRPRAAPPVRARRATARRRKRPHPLRSRRCGSVRAASWVVSFPSARSIQDRRVAHDPGSA